LPKSFYFLPAAPQGAVPMHLEAQIAARRPSLKAQGIHQVDGGLSESKSKLLMQPWWLDWTAGLFPVIVVVFLLRSFLFEPFKIPFGLHDPDAAGGRPDPGEQIHLRRAPARHQYQADRGQQRPQRGDVMVFRYPPKPSLDYIKRVVGVPGDEVAYLNKQLTINGKPVSKTALPSFLTRMPCVLQAIRGDAWASAKFRLLNDDNRPAFIPGAEDFPFQAKLPLQCRGRCRAKCPKATIS
jgi:signal peptidase I